MYALGVGCTVDVLLLHACVARCIKCMSVVVILVVHYDSRLYGCCICSCTCICILYSMYGDLKERGMPVLLAITLFLKYACM